MAGPLRYLWCPQHGANMGYYIYDILMYFGIWYQRGLSFTGSEDSRQIKAYGRYETQHAEFINRSVSQKPI